MPCIKGKPPLIYPETSSVLPLTGKSPLIYFRWSGPNYGTFEILRSDPHSDTQSFLSYRLQGQPA